MAYIDTKYIGDCDTCRHYFDGLGCGLAYCDHGESYSPNMSKIPTADVVEVRHGNFIKRTPYSEAECDQCGKCPKLIFGILPSYCPNCGAKMDGGKF